MGDQRARAGKPAENGRVADFAGRDVERAQFSLEFLGMIDERQQVDERNELAIVQAAGNEARIAVSPLLSVGDDVDAGPLLPGDGQAHGVVSRFLEGSFGEPALDMGMHRFEHPARPWPGADAHHRERGDRRCAERHAMQRRLGAR